MTTPFATMTMARSGYATVLTGQSKTLPPGTYMLLAVPVAEQARADALAHDRSGRPDSEAVTHGPVHAQHFWAALMDLRGEASA